MENEIEIPTGWAAERLGNFVFYQKGKKPKNVSKIKTELYKIPYINIKAFEQNIIDEYTDGLGCNLCEDNDFLMVWDGSRSGYIGKAMKGALGSTLVKIQFPGIYIEYAYHFLKSKYLQINTNAKGTGIPHVEPNLIWNYQFPIAPLAEQHRIVAKIEELFSSLDKAIEHITTAKEQLKVYRQAVLKYAFEGKLTNFTDNNVISRVDEVAEVIDPQPSHRTPAEFINGIPYVSIKDCDYRSNTINFESARKVHADVLIEHIERYSLKKGDFIIGKIGTIGQPIHINLPQNYTLSANVVLIQPRGIDNKYLYYYFQSNIIQAEFKSGQKATAQAAFGIQKVRALPIRVPLPDEQEKIVLEIESRLSVCDKIEESIETSLLQAEALRQSILKRAFAGKLVPQDPNDEPANKLIERIKAERANTSVKKPK